MTLREYEERVDALKENVLRASSKAWVGRRVAERLRTSPVIGNAFFGPETASVENSAIRAIVQRRDELSANLLADHAKLAEVQVQVQAIERESLGICFLS